MNFRDEGKSRKALRTHDIYNVFYFLLFFQSFNQVLCFCRISLLDIKKTQISYSADHKTDQTHTISKYNSSIQEDSSSLIYWYFVQFRIKMCLIHVTFKRLHGNWMHESGKENLSTVFWKTNHSFIILLFRKFKLLLTCRVHKILKIRRFVLRSWNQSWNNNMGNKTELF